MDKWIEYYLQYLLNLKQYSKDTIISYRHVLKGFSLFYRESGLESIDEIRYPLIRGYIVTLHDQKLNHNSIRHHISVLRSFFNYLMDNDVAKQNPFALVNQPKTQKRMPEFLYLDEFEMLVDSIDTSDLLGQRNRMLLELLYATGIRVGEAIKIKLVDMDYYQDLIRVTGKGNKMREVPFNPICEEYMKAYQEEVRPELLAKSKESHPYFLVNQYGRPMTERGVYDIIKRVGQKSGLNKKIHPHMFRHTFATHLLDQGADLRIVQEMMGHADIASTQIYTHVTMDQLKKSYVNAHPMAKNKNKKI